MVSLTTSALLLCAAAFTQAVGVIRVQNRCMSSVYVQPNGAASPTTVAAGADYTQPNAGSGVSIKVGVTPQLPNPLLLAYSVSNGLTYYDLSTLNGDPFEAQGFHVRPSDTTCHIISCNPGESPCTDTYYPGQPSNHNPVYACSTNANINLALCN